MTTSRIVHQRHTFLLNLVLLALVVAVKAADQDGTTTAQSTTQSNTQSTTSPTTTTASSTSSSSSTDTITTSASTTTTPTTSNSATTTFPSLTTTTSASVSTTTIDSSTSTASTSVSGLANAPTLSGYAVPTLIVPDTSAAPFMQHSSLPEGTVFICVGAALGLLGLCVLAWRGWVAWSLNRSVRRAALSYRPRDNKSGYRMGPFGGRRGPGPYDGGENVSMEHLTANTAYAGPGAGVKERSHRRERAKDKPSRGPTSSALFFSPTAGASAGFHQPSNRASGYLPAGYYASGSVAPAAGATIAHIGGPSAAGYGKIGEMGDTPPDTPRSRPSPARRASSGRDLDVSNAYDSHSRVNLGSRTLDLNLPGQRAPSAVLDSWFEHSTAMGRADRL